MDAAAGGYEPDGERLRDLVAARIAEQGEDRRSYSRRLARASRTGGRLRTRWDRLFSAGAGIAAVGAAVAIAVGVTTMLAVTSPGPAARGSGGGYKGAAATGGTGTSAVAATGASTNPATAPGNTTNAGSATAAPPGAVGSSAPSASSDSYVATEQVDQSSNPDWAQLDVVVTAEKPLTALQITIRVAECSGLGMPKSFDTGAYGTFTSSTSTAGDGSVSYVFSLVAGRGLAPGGTVEFAAQFNHGAAGWHPGADTYRISAQTAAAPDAAVTDGVY